MATSTQVRLGAGDEEAARPVQGMEPGKVDVAPVHDVDGPGFRDEQVEHVDIAHLAVGNVDETRDAALEVKQGVHLHRRLGGAEQRPREHRQAQVDGRRVERVDRVGQFQPQVLLGVELPRGAISRWANSA